MASPRLGLLGYARLLWMRPSRRARCQTLMVRSAACRASRTTRPIETMKVESRVLMQAVDAGGYGSLLSQRQPESLFLLWLERHPIEPILHVLHLTAQIV